MRFHWDAVSSASQRRPLPDAPPRPHWGRAALGSREGFVGAGDPWLWRREWGVNRTGSRPAQI